MTSSRNNAASSALESSPPNLAGAGTEPENDLMEERGPDDVSMTQPHPSPSGLASLWTLKNKATLIAVALGTLPVLIVGGISTYIASKQLSQDVLNEQQQFANAISLQMQDFGNRRRREAEILREAAGEEIPIEEKILGLNEANELSALINQRIATLRQNTDDEEKGLQFSVVDEDSNRIVISNDEASVGQNIQNLFPGYSNLQTSETTETFQDVFAEGESVNLITYAPVAQTADAEEDLGVLVYQPMAEAFAAQQSLRLTLLSGTVLTVLLVSTLAAYLANRATQPIVEASKAVAKLGRGQFDTRLVVRGNDELAALSANINVMAEQLEYQLEFIEDTAQRQGLFQAQAALVRQQQEKREALQAQVRSLLHSVERAAEGDLTVQAAVGEGDLGAIATVFNTLIASLRDIVTQARHTTSQIDTALADLASHTPLPIHDISHTLNDIQQLSGDIQYVTASAQRAKKVSWGTAKLVQESGQTVDRSAQTAASFRSSLGETTNRIKQLGSAAQQISQVISLINEISLKTNLIAINTRIDHKQSGKSASGLANATNEIGQLTEQSTRATREIERIVKSIQSEAKEIVNTLEASTAQFAESEATVTETKARFAEIVNKTQELDTLMRSIAEATTTQATASLKVGEVVERLSASSQQSSVAAKQTEATRQRMVNAIAALSSTVEQFRPES